MIITGESSGELYGSLLAGALKAIRGDARIYGVGGERMKEAGVEIFSGIAGAFGLFEAISSYKAVKDTFNKTLKMLDELRPAVLVLIDYPDFNFRVAKAAKSKGIKVLYYVSPQVWAWRRGRVGLMGKITDRIAVILPFEEAIYRKEGIHCEFVGHPILDEIGLMSGEKGEIKKKLGLDDKRPVVSLLPGSRDSELKRHLPVMLELVGRLKHEFPGYQLFMPLAPNIDFIKYKGYMRKFKEEGVLVKKVNALLPLSMSDMAVIASGTAALQAAFLRTPMVVIYRLFPLTYILGRLMLDVKFISLVNILMDKEVVPELIQGRANAETIMGCLRRLMSDDGLRGEMLSSFGALRDMFSGRSASVRVAEMVSEMAGWGR
jgi:lipid-A-disaccharide synthase